MSQELCINQRPCRTNLFLTLLGLGGLVVLGGLYAFFTLEHHGHVLTGMNNQVVWGLPHVFAVFLIVAASGALNVASIGSVFGKEVYKKRAPLSGMLALALLAGGLAILVLDLGRPDRLIVAMTHYNFKSIFAWNMIFYNGFFAIVGLYLITLMDRKLKSWSKPVGYTAFFWRLGLTTATGSIFGFLVARAGYNSALMAPMFIIMSFAYGLAIFMVVQSAMFRWNEMRLDETIRRRLKNLLAVFVGASFTSPWSSTSPTCISPSSGHSSAGYSWKVAPTPRCSGWGKCFWAALFPLSCCSSPAPGMPRPCASASWHPCW